MALGQLNFDHKNKIEVAIARLQEFEPIEGYYLAFSGGKDSECIKELAKMAGVKFDSHYNNTTVDPPELIHHIKKNHSDVIINNPDITMWELIPKKKMPPTRMVRYCCEVLKEKGGEGRFVVTGVRWAESSRRKNTRQPVEFDNYGSKSKKAIENRQIFKMSDNDEKRMMLENCIVKGKHILNPIIDWEDNDVWEFIKLRKLPYCELYDQGWERLGCVGCPLTNKRQRLKEFERYPKQKQAYIRSFDRMIKQRLEEGLPTEWKTGQEVFDWWLGQ